MSSAATIPSVTHHTLDIDNASLHYVSAGESGSPVVLVHGFPESWWAFRKVIPLLAESHRVFAVDLRGFGDSSVAGADFTSEMAAEDLHALIRSLGVGPVHLAAQDIAGATAFRLVATRPEDVLSLTGTEMGLAGFGLEGLGDITHGGSWHIGVLAAPGIAEMLFTGREHDLLGEWAFPAMTGRVGSITDADVTEFSRGYARPNGWKGAIGLYTSMLGEGPYLRALAESEPLDVPALAIGGFGGSFTLDTLSQVVAGEVESVQLEGVGHYVVQEAPREFTSALTSFVDRVDA